MAIYNKNNPISISTLRVWMELEIKNENNANTILIPIFVLDGISNGGSGF
jgi:hypothetical protein